MPTFADYTLEQLRAAGNPASGYTVKHYVDGRQTARREL